MNRRIGWRSVTARSRSAREWYRITDQADSSTEIMIYDEIGMWGVSAADFVRDLATVTARNITLRLNTPGGEIFDGIAIYNALRSHPACVTTVVDGLAASIGSVIMQAGDRRVMMPHSTAMIHDGAGMCFGSAADMRELADLLDKLSDNIAGVYAERAGAGSVAEWRAAMLATSWYTASEAVAAGLADEVESPNEPPESPGVEEEPMMDEWDLSMFRYRNRNEAPAPWVPIKNRASALTVCADQKDEVSTFDPSALRAALSALKG
jgi:ATP-dependent Clp endopeptidase proteolytic subunit ClpP